MTQSLIRYVWEKANRRCEYCHMPASVYAGTFHVDHIVARQHGGETAAENLALACLHCNQRKGPNIAGINRETGKVVRLFHPRQDDWDEHFEWQGVDLIGRTEVGGATVQVLSINDSGFRAIRIALRDEGISDWK